MPCGGVPATFLCGVPAGGVMQAVSLQPAPFRAPEAQVVFLGVQHLFLLCAACCVRHAACRAELEVACRLGSHYLGLLAESAEGTVCGVPLGA